MGNKFNLIRIKMPKQTKRKIEKTKPQSGLFAKSPKNLRIGGTVQPTRDLTKFVRWPRYIMLQRQRRVLYQRLRVPPAINQFSKTCTSNQSKNLWRVLSKYSPESKKDKGKEVNTSKPHYVQFGLNHVTQLVENKLAKLVVIAHDVDPIELVLWLPALCKNNNVPFLIVKDKSRLGRVVRQKTASCVAFTSVRNEDKADLEKLAAMGRTEYNDDKPLENTWGNPVMGIKARHKQEKLEKTRQAELMKKN